MIRDMRQEDKAVFLDMAETFYASNAVAHTVDSHILEAAYNAAISKSPYLRALIIEDNGMPAGFALLSFSYATEVGGLAILLEDLYISETCRGKGLGSQFMQFMEQEYPAAKRFRLEVTRENQKAIGLYSTIGYKAIDYVQMVKDI
ncbi:MAG: GNAT family N-acetyltransferase [Firmicutes bacterium]|nr:GNAT family N-acetyltransferase [Bacillota bacterium]